MNTRKAFRNLGNKNINDKMKEWEQEDWIILDEDDLKQIECERDYMMTLAQEEN